MHDETNSGEDSSRVSLSTARQTINPFICKLESLSDLSEADRVVLETISAARRSVAGRTDLIREGDAPEGVFLIMSGMACRYKVRASGARQIMAYLLPGDSCNFDVALLSAMDHGIATLSPCEVVQIDHATVLGLTRNHPAIARALRLATLVDEATLREWLLNVGRRSAEERIAHLLCELLLRLQAIGQASGGSYALPISQDDLADTTGLSTVHVNRTLHQLRRQNLIELTGGEVRILDLARLQALAEFTPNYLHPGGRAAA